MIVEGARRYQKAADERPHRYGAMRFLLTASRRLPSFEAAARREYGQSETEETEEAQDGEESGTAS
jgi:hypothetical protein